MIVVSNASPLINLAQLGQLTLIHQLYGDLFIPEAVWNEVVIQGAGKPGATEVQDAAWIQRRTVGNKPLVHALRQDLDAGEAEAISLAMEMNADLLLMDERMGRVTAQHFGLRYAGLIGLLVVAKQRGLLAEVKPHLDMLRNVIGFRIAEELYYRVLEDVAEI